MQQAVEGLEPEEYGRAGDEGRLCRILPPHFCLFWAASPRGYWLSGVLIFS